MHDLQLPACPTLGPIGDDEEPVEIPDGWNGDPFTLLPEVYILDDEESELAHKYRNNDISGGYLRSQIAAFRAPQPQEQHERRRIALSELQKQFVGSPWSLPDAFIRVFSDDSINDRLRHNNIWLDLVPLSYRLPNVEDCSAIQFTSEGQGCCYFSLLLSEDGDHCVLYHEDEAVESYPPPPRISPRLSSIPFERCCNSFDVWLAHYFVDCRQHDDRYTEMLQKFPGM